MNNKLPLLTDFLLAIWSTKNGDFQEVHDVNTSQGVERYVYWLLTKGVDEFPQCAQRIRREVVECAHIVNSNDLPSITTLLGGILQIRSDIRGLFVDGDVINIKATWEWFLSGGYVDVGLSDGMPHFLDIEPFSSLTNLVEVKDLCGAPACVPFLRRVSAYSDNYSESLLGLIFWFYGAGLYLMRSVSNPFGEEVFQSLLAGPKDALAADGSRPWLQKFFNLMKNIERCTASEHMVPHEGEGLDHWWQRVGHVYFGEAERRILQLLQTMKPVRLAGLHAPEPALPLTKPNEKSSPKVGLVGYPRGEFGLGEDIRLLKRSLESVGMQAVAFRAPGNSVAREKIDEQSLDIERLADQSGTVFYAMPAFDTLLMHLQSPDGTKEARRRIGFWQWELEKFPAEARYAFDLIDEVWCHSEHSARAFRSQTSKPVIKVPLPVSVPDVNKSGLSDFGIDENCFVFFSSFDGASYISRKNPLAVIEAFQLAFSKTNRSVKLILKVMNQQMCSLWRECLLRAALDDRIIIFDCVVNRSVYYEILKSVDAVVSLHRAEGFGRLMAEAMACGIPVIASAYSGNMDYMTSENSWMVPGEMAPMFPGDYPFRQGQRWFSADIGEAARMMKECRDDNSQRNEKVKIAKFIIDERYSIEACGKVYKELLGMEF